MKYDTTKLYKVLLVYYRHNITGNNSISASVKIVSRWNSRIKNKCKGNKNKDIKMQKISQEHSSG